MAKILVAEPDPDVRKSVRALLETEFHDVDVARNGEQALHAYMMGQPDLVVLGVRMPILGGHEVCRRIRMGDARTPLMFLSKKSGESDRVLGLELGADDYLPIPFGGAEFLARVKALLRRGRTADPEGTTPDTVFRLGSFMVNGRELALSDGGGRRVDISLREYALLRYFTTHPNEVALRRELLEYAWGKGVYAYSRTIDTHVCTLRRKIAGCGWHIETVSGLGYRLRLEVPAA